MYNIWNAIKNHKNKNNLTTAPKEPTNPNCEVFPQLGFLSSLFYFLRPLSDLNCTLVLRREDSPLPQSFQRELQCMTVYSQKTSSSRTAIKIPDLQQYFPSCMGRLVASSCSFVFRRPVRHSLPQFPGHCKSPDTFPAGTSPSLRSQGTSCPSAALTA